MLSVKQRVLVQCVVRWCAPPPVVDALAAVTGGARRASPLGVLALGALAGPTFAAALREGASGLCAYRHHRPSAAGQSALWLIIWECS